MADTVADVLLARLREWGVRQVFGYPGDGINGLLAAWGRAENNPQFVQARHEEMAAFEAVGYAKFADEVGICAATSGPGAIHLLNGLYDAKLDHVPVVALVGQTERSAMGGSYQQEVDLLSLYKDVCSDYVQMCTVPQQLPNLIDRAIRIALTESAPTAIIFPSDVFELPYEPPEHAFKQVPSSIGMTSVTPRADDAGVAKAAEILNAGKKVALLVGQGARGCVPELTEVADLLGAGAAKALLGKDVLPDDLPWVTGAIGLLGTTASYHMMMDCDTLLTVGSNFPYTQFMPKLDQARAIQIDRSGKWIGMRYPYELNLVGDAKTTLQALIPKLARKTDREWRETIEGNVASWWQTIQRQAATDADPINPMRIFAELSDRLPDNAIVAADSGSAANWYARVLRFRAGMRGSLSGTLATMGPGVPYVIGAKWAHPDRPAIAMVGDGAMQMNGMAELITVSRYWRQWSRPSADHRRAAQQRPQPGDLGDARHGGRAQVRRVADAARGRLRGLRARPRPAARRTWTSPTQLGEAWDQAFAADRPTVLDVRCDPNVPPIPPHATLEQVKSMIGAVLHGDEDTWGFIKQGTKQKVQQFLPGNKDAE